MGLDTLMTIAPNLFFPLGADRGALALLVMFLKAMLLGLTVAAPVGPMAILCMRRTLTDGWRLGLATGAGIAAADGVYAGVATLGLTGLSAFLQDHARPFHLAAGLALTWLGYATLRPRIRRAGAAVAGAPTVRRAWASSFLLTVTNPPTLITFAALLTVLSPAGQGAGLSHGAAATVAGVAAGSLCWWSLLVGGVGVLRRGLGPKTARALDVLSGGVFLAFALVELHRAMA